MNRISKFFLLLSFVTSIMSAFTLDAQDNSNEFLGMWSLEINDGGVGWLHVFQADGYLDGELMWRGGSVVPVGNIYLVDENNLVVTRVYNVKRDDDRQHTLNFRLEISKLNNEIVGRMIAPPSKSEIGEKIIGFKGTLLPNPGEAPDISNVKYGKPIKLFNGENLDGWKLINPKSKNGFHAKNGTLVNQPIQDQQGKHIHYGNLRTIEEFEDFNLKLEVNVPKGSNSGIYLKGIYEVQVNDSYGKEVDSHHMGALYSRISPSKSAEKPAGTWQTFDITLCDRHVTVILNDVKIIDNQPIYGPTGGAINADVFAPGPIFLQGDHGEVSYKNIVLTPIIQLR